MDTVFVWKGRRLDAQLFFPWFSPPEMERKIEKSIFMIQFHIAQACNAPRHKISSLSKSIPRTNEKVPYVLLPSSSPYGSSRSVAGIKRSETRPTLVEALRGKLAPVLSHFDISRQPLRARIGSISEHVCRKHGRKHIQTCIV